MHAAADTAAAAAAAAAMAAAAAAAAVPRGSVAAGKVGLFGCFFAFSRVSSILQRF